MERENRYVVVKREDIDNYLSTTAKEQFFKYLDRIAQCRKNNGKQDTNYVVVGEDWPMYEQTWQAIEEWVDATRTTL